MEKSKKKKKKRREPTYERKAFEMAREHYEKQKQKAIHERRVFRSLQIIPTKAYYDDSLGHIPGENNWVGYGFDVHPHVFFGAGTLLLIFIVMTIMFKEQSIIFFKAYWTGSEILLAGFTFFPPTSLSLP